METQPQPKSAISEAYEQISDRSLWEDKIKDKCFLCGEKIPKTWSHYSQMGNCCFVCSGWTGMSQREKKICIVKTIQEWRALSKIERNKEKLRIKYLTEKKNKSYEKGNIRKAR